MKHRVFLMKAKNKTKQQTKKARRSARISLGECPTRKWLSSNRTRPKTVVLTLNRDANGGYLLQEATILKRVNQYGVVPIRADVRAITKDLNQRGVEVR